MELSTDKRYTLCQGIDWLIKEQECEIEKIKNLTETDISIAKILENVTGKPFSLEVEKERRIQKVRAEISRLQDLRQDINDLSNRLLLIPNYIQLQLIAK